MYKNITNKNVEKYAHTHTDFLVHKLKRGRFMLLNLLLEPRFCKKTKKLIPSNKNYNNSTST